MKGRALRTAGFVLIVAGVAGLGLAIISGDAEVALLFIVPVIYGTGPLAAMSILSAFAGMVLLFLSFALVPPAGDADGPSGSKREFGGVVLIGPIPIVFGSARSMKGWAKVGLAALSLLVLLLFMFIVLR